jgi:hypothetical protein
LLGWEEPVDDRNRLDASVGLLGPTENASSRMQGPRYLENQDKKGAIQTMAKAMAFLAGKPTSFFCNIRQRAIDLPAWQYDGRAL